MRIKDLTANKAISMLQHEDLRQRQENTLNLSEKPRNTALKANSRQSKRHGKGQSQFKKKKARNSDKQGLYYGFCNIRDSYKEEDCQKKYLEKHLKKKQKNEENSTETRAYSFIPSKAFSTYALRITRTQALQIIDFRATQHLTCDFDALYKYRAYKAVSTIEGISSQVAILSKGKRDLFCVSTDQKI